MGVALTMQSLKVPAITGQHNSALLVRSRQNERVLEARTTVVLSPENVVAALTKCGYDG